MNGAEREAWQQVNDFWFGALRGGFPPASRNDLWFSSDRRTDETIRQRFGGLVEQALVGELSGWRAAAHGELALVLLLDQFTRNIYRGAALAFAGDAQAVAIVREAIAAGRDQQLAAAEQLFFYMPLEHSEQLADHDLGIERMSAVVAASRRHPMALSMLDFAHGHRAIIEQFGRYPYRNAVLDRETTPAEQAWLDRGGERYGQ